MKKLVYLFFLTVWVVVSACNSKKNANDGLATVAQDSIDAHGLQRMQTSKAEANIHFNGKDYHSLVLRSPDESLPQVSNEMGDVYIDNKIVLRLTRGGETVLDKTFTKNDFASVVDDDFLKKSVLEGIVYDKTTPQGIVFAGSVCYPQTDLYVPLSITVTSDGKFSVAKVEILEEAYESDTVNAKN